MKQLFAVIVLSLLVGCTLPRFKGADFRDTERPIKNSEKATVFVYRVGEGNPLKIGAVMIFVDDKKAFHVRDKGFTWFFLTPGLHMIKGEWPWDEYPLFEEGHFSEKFLSVNVESGKTYYINYRIIQDSKPSTYAESTSILGKSFSKSHIKSVELVLEIEEDALKNLEGCGYQTNKFND